MFKDRNEAGKKLGQALEHFIKKNPVVLAIPCGGVEVGFQVAGRLKCEFSLIVVRKLPLPENPEAGFGAIAEDGSTFFVNRLAGLIPDEKREEIVNQQKKEIKRRIKTLRSDRPLPEIRGRNVILVDDGIAMGSTIRASIKMCRSSKAGSITVASPVAAPQTAAVLESIADHVVILEKPPFFQAVAQVYQHWYDVPDDEVVEIMKKYVQRRIEREQDADT